MTDATSDNDTAGDRAGLDPDAHDTTDPAGPAAAQQTVTNDAVAGETVTDGPAVPTAPEAAPTSDAHSPAQDGYVSPRHESSEEIDLDDGDGRTGQADGSPTTSGPAA